MHFWKGNGKRQCKQGHISKRCAGTVWSGNSHSRIYEGSKKNRVRLAKSNWSWVSYFEALDTTGRKLVWTFIKLWLGHNWRIASIRSQHLVSLEECRRNKGTEYFLNGKRIHKSEVQRELGVLVQDSQRVNLQVESVVRKANAVLAFILRGFEHKSKDVMLVLYKAQVRRHLE